MSILGELVAQLLGEAAVEAASRNKKPRRPFPEGEGNASLGALSLFVGFLSLLFSGAALLGAVVHANYDDMGPATVFGMAVFSFLAALFAHRSGRKAPHVTRRNLWMARLGTWLSLPTMAVSSAAALLCVVRLLQWTL